MAEIQIVLQPHPHVAAGGDGHQRGVHLVSRDAGGAPLGALRQHAQQIAEVPKICGLGIFAAHDKVEIEGPLEQAHPLQLQGGTHHIGVKHLDFRLNAPLFHHLRQFDHQLHLVGVYTHREVGGAGTEAGHLRIGIQAAVPALKGLAGPAAGGQLYDQLRSQGLDLTVDLLKNVPVVAVVSLSVPGVDVYNGGPGPVDCKGVRRNLVRRDRKPGVLSFGGKGTGQRAADNQFFHIPLPAHAGLFGSSFLLRK